MEENAKNNPKALKASETLPKKKVVGIPFTAGNTASRGNPYAKKQAMMKAAFWAQTTKKDMQEVWAAVKTKAKKGDFPFCKLFMEYAYGKPVQPVEQVETTSQFVVSDEEIDATPPPGVVPSTEE